MAHWESHAEFMLGFEIAMNEHETQVWRTRVWSLRVGEKECDQEKVFDGIGPNQWVNWILAHAQLVDELTSQTGEKMAVSKPLPETQQTEHAQPTAADAISIDIQDIQLTEIESSANRPGKNLMVEVRFEISGADEKAILLQDIRYQVEIHTLNLEDGKMELVTYEQGQLLPNNREYKSQQIFPLPELGRYVPQVIVLLLPPVAMPATYKGRSFEIVQ